MEIEHKANILLVDDEPANRMAVRELLSDLGQNIIEAGSGEEALRAVLEREFAVILMDVNMPGMGGFEVAELIRQRPKSQHTPLVFLTGSYQTTFNKFRAYSVGAVDYLQKPVVPEILRSKVSVFVELFNKTEKVLRQAEELRESQRREHERELAAHRERVKAKERRVQEELLRRDHAVLRAIVETIPTAVAIVHPDGSIHFGNQAFLSVAGPGPHSTLTEWMNDLNADEDFRKELRQELARALERPAEPIRLEHSFHAHNQVHLHWIITMQRLRSDIGGHPAVVVAGIDVSDQKRLIIQLSNARAQMEDFLAAAAHDLKAPLITIGHNVKFAQIGLGSNISADAAKCLDRVHSAARGMLDLLKQVSDVSNAGRDTEPRLLHSSRELVRAALRQLEGVTAERQAQVKLGDNLPQVYCQGTKLIQVFANLISNAVKYTPVERIPQIEIGYVPEPDQSFFVRDNGIGIPDESHGEIFELFRRLTSDATVEGQGVGLTIVKRIVELHGGRIWVESVPGEGSTFHFTVAQRLRNVALVPTSIAPRSGWVENPANTAAALTMDA